MSECTHHFEHVKQTRPFTEREYMQCTKCGLQNPLGLFQHWDTQHDGQAVKWPPRDNGGKLPSGLTPINNHTGHGILVIPYPGFFNRGGHIRTCIVWKNKDYDLIERLTHIFVPPSPWYWQCRLCGHGNAQRTWNHAYKAATRHAHNHH